MKRGFDSVLVEAAQFKEVSNDAAGDRNDDLIPTALLEFYDVEDDWEFEQSSDIALKDMANMLLE